MNTLEQNGYSGKVISHITHTSTDFEVFWKTQGALIQVRDHHRNTWCETKKCFSALCMLIKMFCGNWAILISWPWSITSQIFMIDPATIYTSLNISWMHCHFSYSNVEADEQTWLCASMWLAEALHTVLNIKPRWRLTVLFCFHRYIWKEVRGGDETPHIQEKFK